MSLEDDIRSKNLKNIYLLYGREAYLRRNYRKFLLKIWFPDGTDGNMNFTAYEGSNVDMNEILSQADTMPFFSEIRVIEIQNSGLLSESSKGNDREKLNEYLKNMPDYLRILIIEDDAKKTYGLFKTIEKIGLCEEINTFHGSRYEKWIMNKIKSSGLSITSDAYKEFYQRTSSDMKAPDLMESVSLELDKLISYCMDKGSIEKRDVEEIVTGQVNAKIFNMIDALFKNDREETMKVYDELLVSKEAPEMILSVIEKQLISLLTLASKIKNGENIESSWLNQKNGRLIRQMGVKKIQYLISSAAKYDNGIKSGKLNRDVALTLFITDALSK